MNLSLANQPQTAFGISAVVSLLIGLTLVYAIWQWHSDWVLAHEPLNATPVIVQEDATTRLIAAIPSEHLFGQALAKTGEVPITNLQLRVTGIVKIEGAEGNGTSKAYISIANQPSKIYQVGASLPYGVKINSITATAVILDNDHHLEQLPLPREKLQFKPPYSEESP